MSPREDLVVLSLEAWDDVWRRNQHLVTRLLRDRPGLRVLFVEPAADPVHALTQRRLPLLGRGLRPGPALDGVPPGPDGAPRLWLHQPTKALPRRFDARADDRIAASVRRAAARLGMDEPLLWVNDPSGVRMLDAGWPALYDVTDDWLAAHRTPSESRRLVADEGVLLAACAEVVVCSAGLLASKGPAREAAGGAPLVLVTNGVDLERYRAPHPRPADLPAGRVALYAGTVHPDRFDVPLLLETAGRALEGTVVLLGPVVDLSAAERDALAAAGVVSLGPRPFTAVPAYLQHAEVLLVPHLVDGFTDSLDPIKLYEYRAVGRPVVATPVAGFRDAPGVTVAPRSRYADAVAHALASPAPTLPDDAVPTWAGQARLMGEVLDRLRAGATR